MGETSLSLLDSVVRPHRQEYRLRQSEELKQAEVNRPVVTRHAPSEEVVDDHGYTRDDGGRDGQHLTRHRGRQRRVAQARVSFGEELRVGSSAVNGEVRR